MRTRFTLLLCLPLRLVGQVLVPDLLTVLPAQMNETSGLIVVNSTIWTILDSGNPPALYAVAPDNGSVLRTVQLTGATNVDFEEITADANWVYIGDFGNNLGSRTDLRIYRIPRSALEDEGVTEVAVDTIHFTFSDQTDFTPAWNATNFDQEAMIAVDDSLFLFSKRWLDERTRLYALPATPGDHVAEARGIFDTNGVITAASWDGVDRLALLGHEDDPGQPFIWLFSNVEGHDFFGANALRRNVDLFDHQTEGIAWRTPDEWILSNEWTAAFPASLWSVEVGQTVLDRGSIGERPSTFPQPADREVRISGLRGPTSVRIVDHTGREIASFRINGDGPIDTSSLVPGIYVMVIRDGSSLWRLPLMIVH
ncbi:MAG: T9SS type A sorting domain-containing protein [Flavobacteriales bacterium]|nr:T9SS type A sorting domain-containing protein [Flavobacteriales bacterium]